MSEPSYVFSSESVSEGHPDTVCDYIVDSILDAYLALDPRARVACEVLCKSGVVVLAGEITSNAPVDREKIARAVIAEVGYTDPRESFHAAGVKVLEHVTRQSPNISQGVDADTAVDHEQGASTEHRASSPEYRAPSPEPRVPSTEYRVPSTEYRYNGRMALLSDSDLKQLKETFADLTSPVTLHFFTQTLNCETCDIARQILGEVVRISDRITVEEHNFQLEKDVAARYGIDRVPAVAVVGLNGGGQAADHGIRFFGAPQGYEFSSLLESILLVGGVEDVALSQTTTDLLASIKEPVHIQVFVTPT